MRLEAKLTHPIDQSRFYKLRSKRTLAEVLCTNPRELKRTLRNASYRISQTPKADGTYRTIYDPCAPLKRIQRRIGDLLSRIEMPPWTFFGRKGVCYVDNARYHEGARYLVKSDLSSFYDHCDREHVYQFFKNTMKCTPDVADILCDLTTYRLDDGSTVIPTGSPSAQTSHSLPIGRCSKRSRPLQAVANANSPCTLTTSPFPPEAAFPIQATSNAPSATSRDNTAIASRPGRQCT